MPFQGHIPLKYKILSVMLFVLLLGFGGFFYFAQKIFSEDKKLFVMELNLAALKATVSDLKLELKGRLEELQVFIPRIYQTNEGNPFLGLNDRLEDELLGVSFYKKNADGSFEVSKSFRNQKLLKERSFGEEFYETLQSKQPVTFSVSLEQGFELSNRSISYKEKDVPILSVILNGSFINDDSANTLIVVDLLQDFLRKKLQEQEQTEIFLISRKGTLLSHADSKLLVKHAISPFNHPIVKRLHEKQLPRESFEVEVGNEPYLCNISESGFSDTYAVSQVKKSQAFIALKMLMKSTVFIALLIFSVAIVLSILFASNLTRDIKILKEAAQRIGHGDWDIHLDIHSNDEIQQVGESFQWMADRLTELVKETAEKARMEDELKTAQLVQSTLLANPNTKSEHFNLAPYYFPATECGGDFWDIYQYGNKVTVVIGDATGHGAGAAIITAIAKSSFSTLNTVYGKNVLTPDQFLSVLNRIICKLCKGELLMTACVVQLDLSTGEILVGNAGHESPLVLKQGNEKTKCEVLFNRGERLGFSEAATYTSEHYQMKPSEILLLYTDGISEAKNADGKELGERALKKVFQGNGIRSIAKIRDEIENKTKTHIGNSQVKDDITFVLLEWKKVFNKEEKVGQAA